VGVDEVVVAGPVVGFGAQEPAGEGAQLGREVVLGEAFEGPGGEVVDEDAGGGFDGGGFFGAGGAGEDLDFDAGAGEFAGGVEDVDVHAAGVARARLGERGGVDGDHRYASDVELSASCPEGRRAPLLHVVVLSRGGLAKLASLDALLVP
jgi:hypothetical protein